VIAPVNISNGRKCSHQSPNPKFTWKSAFLTAFVQKCTNSFDGAALPQRLWTLEGFPFETFVLPCFSRLPMVGDECLPKNWHVFRRKRNEEITSESGKG
jgi:hypothetical protein